MKVKRYGIHFNYGDPVMVERPDGEYYSRADLIAAGCLVPVPDGDACDIWSCNSLFMRHGDTIYTRPHEDMCDDGWWVNIADRSEFTAHIAEGVYVEGLAVQPVRLVRLEDVG